MIKADFLFRKLKEEGVNYFCGVPDSLLKPFCSYLSANTESNNHVTTANEGGAIGLAIGYHLATSKVPLVYMQNSGLGNAINPLLSLADLDVYKIPMLLMIGWRGEPNIKDEPQHIKQGKVTLETLSTMGIPYEIIKTNETGASEQIHKAVSYAIQSSSPFAIIIRKGCIENNDVNNQQKATVTPKREDAIKMVVDNITNNEIVISTTGMASRELFEYRKTKGHKHQNDFLTVGGMGHASQIALGIATQCPSRRVICLDGDGAVLMHMGSMAIIGQSKALNFKHIVINNGAHDSVGGQATVAKNIDLPAIATACGYTSSKSVESIKEVATYLPIFLNSNGPCFLEIIVDKGYRKNLGRPTTSPVENKLLFMGAIDNATFN